MAERIAVGMSGGVDSSVTAHLLKQQGYDVIGIFMNNWDETDDAGVCSAADDFADVRRVCDHIGIPYYSVSFEQQYRQRVFAHFLDELQAGRTPNPDILCNREIKFGELLRAAHSIGAQRLATGHYARVRREGGAWRLYKAVDDNKDQTYFLHAIDKEALESTLFPIGELRKQEVRTIALTAKLPTAKKKDSTGICFIGERNMKRFLARYLPARPGPILHIEGGQVGTHEGVFYYTIGQRRGLGIGGTGTGEPFFVVGKDVANNILYVDQGEQSPHLYSLGLIAREPHFLAQSPSLGVPVRVGIRCRHRQPEQPGTMTVRADGQVEVRFDCPQRAVTPGQSAVFYIGQECIGGAVIAQAQPGVVGAAAKPSPARSATS